jgi:hypothetical protein
MSLEPESVTPAEDTTTQEKTKTLQVITWFSVGMAVAAIGIYFGNELRCRSKFKKRTPYDFYSHAGEQHAGEFGVGI